MSKPALTDYEEQRLMALECLGLLDTGPDEGFDRLTRLVKAQFDVPIACISLIDEHRQWIKSGQGIGRTDISRDESLCAHAILEEGLFYVPDTMSDLRFSDNPQVTGEPFIRFYAAVPLSVDGGMKVGTLAVMDRKPRHFTSDQFAIFKDFGECVEQQLMQAKLQSDANFLVSQTSRLNTLLETVGDGIVTIDDHGSIESLNTEAAHIFGYEPYEILGENFNQLMPDLGRGGWSGYVEIFFGRNRGTELKKIEVVTGVRKDGTLFPMDLSAREMILEGKRLYTGIIRDVTDRKQAEDGLKRGQALLEVTKENVPVGITFIDENLRLAVVNQEALKLFDMPGEYSQVGTYYPDIVRYLAKRGDYGTEGVEDVIEERINFAKNPQSERSLRTIDNTGRSIEVTTRAMPGGGFVSIYMDITDRLRSEEKLEKLLLQANAANEAKSDFLSTISHEIRTPLNGVIGVAHMLTETNLDTDQQKKLNTILKSGNTLLDLINDVLDMSKIESGNLEMEYITCDLREILTSLMPPFEMAAWNKGLELTLDIAPTLGSHYRVDPTRLRQIIMNLLSNALKFTEKGQVRVSLTTRGNTGNGKQNVVLIIADTGGGIPKDRQDSIFDSFSQADTSVTRKFGGTGLGLSIVKNLVTLMNGTILVTSEMGQGSRFDVEIPLDLASRQEIDDRESAAQPSVHQKLKPLKILIAEDNDVNAMIIKASLEKLGHSYRLAENGKMALQLAEQEAFDLILMDVHMPEMDGVEATKLIRLKEALTDIPIVGLTADAFSERHALFIDAGMNDVLTKPFTKEQLIAVIAKNMVAGPEASIVNELSSDTVGLPGTENGFLALATDEPIGCDQQMQTFLDELGRDVTRSLIQKSPSAILKELESLREGLEKQDSQIVLRAAHTIAGVAGSMCAVRLAKQASIIENKSNEMTEILETLPEIERTVEETIVWWSHKAQDVG